MPMLYSWQVVQQIWQFLFGAVIQSGQNLPKSAKNNAKYIVCAFGVPKPVIFGADVFAPMEKSAGVFEYI